MRRTRELLTGSSVKVEADVIFLSRIKEHLFCVATDVTDATKFAIAERYEQESDVETHVNNPYYKEFGAYVKPLLSNPPVREKDRSLMIFSSLRRLGTSPFG